MASLYKKVISGKPYWYLREMGWVDGKPKMVSERYVGTAADIEALLDAREAQMLPERTRHLDFGAVAAAWGLLADLGAAAVIDEETGTRPPGLPLSPGTYLALAALNRVVDPCSKRGFADWWRTTAADRFTKIPASALDHRRFWDAFRAVPLDALPRIEEKLALAACARSGLDTSSVALDMTNFATFIDTGNARAPIAQRGPVVVVGDQHVLAEDLLLQPGPPGGVDGPGQPQVAGGIAGELPGDDAADPGVMGDLADLRLDLAAGPAGLAAGQGGGQLIELPGGPGQRGAVEAAGLMGVQLGRMGQDGPAPGAVDDPAGVIGGQLAEPVLINDGPGGRGHGEQVTAVTGGHRPHVVQVRAGQQREVGLGVLPGVEDDGHLGAVLPGSGGQRSVPGGQRLDHLRELGDVWPVPGIGVGQQRDAVAGDHQAEADQPQVRAFLLDLAAEVIAGYRSQSEAEFSFRQMKDPHAVSFSPMFHWTEHNIRVHVLTCVMALQIAHLMRLQAQRAGLRMSVRELLTQLAGIGETILIYPAGRGRPKARRILTETTGTQDKLTQIFHLGPLRTRR